MALKALSNGTYQVYIYDPDAGRKRYVGVAPTEIAARTLEAAMRDPSTWPIPGLPGVPWTLASKGEDACRVCGLPAEHLHHLVPSAELANYEANPHVAGIPVCNACHFGWHHRAVTIFREYLLPEEVAFAASVMGDSWLTANYPAQQQPPDLNQALFDEVVKLRLENRRLRGQLPS